MNVVDVDEIPTWPGELCAFVESRSDELRGTTDCTPDLRPDDADRYTIQELLSGRLVKAYHATRLLHHEVDMVLEQGLRLLDAILVNERIRLAHEAGAIGDEQRDHLLRNHVFARKFQVRSRAGKVCLFLSRHTLDDEPDGLWRLLAQWGGEGIYWTQREDFERAHLRGFGNPTIVVVGLDLSDPGAGHLIFPGLLHAFLGTQLNLQHRGAGVHYRAPVPPQAILDIWQPGNPEYDRHAGLWRT